MSIQGLPTTGFRWIESQYGALIGYVAADGSEQFVFPQRGLLADRPLPTVYNIGAQYFASDEGIGYTNFSGLAWVATHGTAGGTAGGATVFVTADDTAVDIAAKVETLNASVEADSPLERGNVVQYDPGPFETGPLDLSTMQTEIGVKGSSQIRLDPTGLTAGEYGHRTLLDDSLSKAGIRGNGVIRDLDYNGQVTDFDDWDVDHPGVTVHGYWAADRASGKCITHRIDNSAFYNYPGHGVYIGVGNDQMVATRLRAEGNRGFGIVIKSSDCKLHDIGSTSIGGALWVDGAAPEIETVDLFMPTSFEGECTVLLNNAARTQIKGGTISGRTIIRGRNDQGLSVRYEACGILLADLAFKHDQDLANTRYYSGAEQIYVYDSYIEIEDADGVRIRAPRFGFDTALTGSQLPDYLIKITTSTGNRGRLGTVFLDQTIGMLDLIGRPGEAGGVLSRMGCKKHWSNEPHLTIFDWGTPGQIEEVPLWKCDHADLTMRTHIKCDGTTYLKADYPFAYLAQSINPGGTHGTLDDVNTNFTLRAYSTATPSSTCWAMRAVP